MNERLTNITLLIGKDPEQGRLLVSADTNGGKMTFAMGSPGSVPNSVSRCKPAEGVAHCKINIASDGSMTITNLKPQNVTFVNDIEIVSKKINLSGKISLGEDRYPLNLNDILQNLSNLMSRGSIKHLEPIWNEYENAIESISIKQQERNRKRLLPMIITLSASLLAPILTAFGTETLFVTVPIAAVSLFIYIKMYTEKDTSIEDKKNASDKFMEHYVCPYEGCRHFLGYSPYKILRQNKKCPYCGKPWTSQ